MHDELQSLGVTFVSKNEQFDTSAAIGEAMMRIILIFAELERKTTAERVTAVMLSRAGQTASGTVAASPSAIRGQRRQSRLVPVVRDGGQGHARRMARAVRGAPVACCGMSPSGSTTPASSQRRGAASRGRRPRYARHPDEPVVHRPVRLQRPLGRQGHREARRRASGSRVEHHHEPILSEDRVLPHEVPADAEQARRGPPLGQVIRQEAHPRLQPVCCGAAIVRVEHVGQPADRRQSERLPPISVRLRQPAAQGNVLHQQVHLGHSRSAPFVLNYAANIIRAARKSAAEATTAGGSGAQAARAARPFEDGRAAVSHRRSLGQLLAALRSRRQATPWSTGRKYAFSSASGERDPRYGQPAALRKRKLDDGARPSERALYLYDDEAMPEKDFVVAARPDHRTPARGGQTRGSQELAATKSPAKQLRTSRTSSKQGQLLHHGRTS